MNFTYEYADELPTVLCQKCKRLEIKRSCTETCDHMVCVNCILEGVCPICLEYMPADLRERILRSVWGLEEGELNSDDE